MSGGVASHHHADATYLTPFKVNSVEHRLSSYLQVAFAPLLDTILHSNTLLSEVRDGAVH